MLKLFDENRPFNSGSTVIAISFLSCSLNFPDTIALPTLSTKNGVVGPDALQILRNPSSAVAGHASSSSNLGKSTSCGRPIELFFVLLSTKRIPPLANRVTFSQVNNLTPSTVIKYSETRDAAKKCSRLVRWQTASAQIIDQFPESHYPNPKFAVLRCALSFLTAPQKHFTLSASGICGLPKPSVAKYFKPGRCLCGEGRRLYGGREMSAQIGCGDRIGITMVL